MGLSSDIHSHSAISWHWYRYQRTHVVAVPWRTWPHRRVRGGASTQYRQFAVRAAYVCACACAQCQVKSNRQSLAQHEVPNLYKLAIPAAKCWHQTAR